MLESQTLKGNINHSVCRWCFGELSLEELCKLAKEIGLALLVLIIMGVLIAYVRKFFLWTANKIIDQKDKRIHGIKIRNFTLFDANQQVNALLNVNTFLKFLLDHIHQLDQDLAFLLHVQEF